MQHKSQLIFRRSARLAMLAVMAAVTTGAASDTEWKAFAGAQSPDLGSQALAFLPNELWIHAGDSIRWAHASSEIHTVTFLTPGQVRPPIFGSTFGVPVGCPGNTPMEPASTALPV
jgi:plastocyanin